ncbi:hypothetical protein [Kitasatospora cathayae]|uniref:Uncharacterized protein n=1 Tax=Kitasatospora cathayae TaxID=3004092 RepID=A0ABY7QB93_9ACTN|nr:hypothetical protein [Kitasatospora sp. HUAS 3-15]WBP89499.1 hypothetical protein O1G21_29110 [Kitasatospora sp. HUAS 3-15]
MTNTPPPALDRADEALIRYRAQRPSQFTARTIRDDYTAMLAEIGRLRAELAAARDRALTEAAEMLRQATVPAHQADGLDAAADLLAAARDTTS